jgi:pilus assembly protein CpaE
VSVPAARCVVVETDPALVAACSAAADAAPGLDIVASVSQSRVLGGSLPACDVLLVADAPGLPAAGWAEAAARSCPHVAIVLLTEQADIETYRVALRVGACAVTTLPVTPAALASTVVDALRARGSRGGRHDVSSGEVVAVAGARGGVGTSAVALAFAARCRALLVDLAGTRSGLAFALGASQDRSLTELAHAGEALAAGIATVAVEHPSGLRFVPGPPDPDVLGALTPGWGLGLVCELRACERISVLDCGGAAEGAAREALVAADRLLVVVTPVRAALEAARSLVLDAARWGAAAGAELVVNRWSRRAEVGLRAIARTVDAPVAAVVRDDRRWMSGYDNGRVDVGRWSHAGPLGALSTLVERGTHDGA